MKHVFQRSMPGSDVCTICRRNEFDHSDIAICEACDSVGPCELVGTILMCALCQERQPEPPPIDDGSRVSRIAKLKYMMIKELPVDDHRYFVSEITPIVDLEIQLGAIFDSSAPDYDTAPAQEVRYELAKLVEQRIFEFRKRMFAAKNEIIACNIGAITDQKYLNQLVPKLREEERAKFREYDISYTPAVATASIKPSSPRMSATDRQTEAAAKSLNMTPEQFKLNIAKQLELLAGIKCSCAVTPGMCRVHPSK